MDLGSTYDGHPELAVQAASSALDHAADAARQMYQWIADAQVAINAAAYGGPESDTPDD